MAVKKITQLLTCSFIVVSLFGCEQLMNPNELQEPEVLNGYQFSWQAPTSRALIDLPLLPSDIAYYQVDFKLADEVIHREQSADTELQFQFPKALQDTFRQQTVTAQITTVDQQGRASNIVELSLDPNAEPTSTLAIEQSSVIFADDFESHPEWVAGYTNTKNPTGRPHGNPAPKGWTIIRTDPARAPSMGDTDRHESIEIRTAPEKARSGVKSAQFYRDALLEPNWKWWSDGILAKQFEDEYPEIWTTFYMKWQPDSLAPKSLSKIFRMSHVDVEVGSPEIFRGFRDGHNGPMMIWVNGLNDYGLRNTMAMRGYPQTTNYYFEDGMPQQLPRNMFSGDMSLNWDTNLRDLNRDGIDDNENLRLYTQTDGLLIPGNGHEGMISHADFWGNEQNSQWRRFDFYLKMNSAPGIADGVIEQYVDGQLVFANYTTPWIGSSATDMVGWNSVKLGGNDWIKTVADELRFEDWYAIDDLEVRTNEPMSPAPVEQFSYIKTIAI